MSSAANLVSQQVRHASSTATHDHPWEAVVVGAGPAGITAVGNLLEQRVEPILWVDPYFNGGRVNGSYREVPSNTKVKLFIDFANAVTPFQQIVNGTVARDERRDSGPGGEVSMDTKDKLQHLRQLDQQKGCDLSHAADMCLMLTEGLKHYPGVYTDKGLLSAASLDRSTSQWTIEFRHEAYAHGVLSVPTKRLVLCTGSEPTSTNIGDSSEKPIHLDDALSPTKLTELLSPLGPTSVAVIGASHSAVLIIRNLANLALSTKPDLSIKWFSRHPLRYAEYDATGAVTARDNTGLKGEAAVWAKENLEPNSLPSSSVSKVLDVISYEKSREKEVFAEHLNGVDFVIQAIGFKPNPLPTFTIDGESVQPQFDHDKGVFTTKDPLASPFAKRSGRVVPGLYGAGIAFPERVYDQKYGHAEMNVGFWKFMKAVQKWSPNWTPA